jgi:flagellar biosynthetic protein FliO
MYRLVLLARPRSYARRMAALALVLACNLLVTAAAAAAKAPAFKRDDTPLPASISGLDTAGTAAQASSSGGGNAALRMLFGLAIVLAVIYGLYRLLKRSADKNDKTVRAHGGMTVVASTPLAQSRNLHLVRVGQELVLVGSSEQGVTPIRVYDAEEVRRLGLDVEQDPRFVPNSTPGDKMSFGNALVESLRKRTAR